MSDKLNIVSINLKENVDDLCLKQLKDKAKKKKGRGFMDNGEGSGKSTFKSSSVLSPSSAQSLEEFKSSVSTDNTIKFYYEGVDQILPQKSREGWVVFVSGVHEEATEDDIYNVFSEISQIKHLTVNLNRRTAFMASYCLVKYETYEDALKAINTLNGYELLGRKLEVNWCYLKQPSSVMIVEQK